VESDSFNVIKPLLILIIISIVLAHSSLILLGYRKKSLVNIVIVITIIFSSIISLMLIGLIIWEWEVEDLFFRVLGVFAIFVALGTIVNPILNKLSSFNEKKDDSV